MRSGSRSGAQHVPSRGARANAERLWRETVALTPAADPNDESAPLLTPTLSSPGGRRGRKGCCDRRPLSAPGGGEGQGEVGGHSRGILAAH